MTVTFWYHPSQAALAAHFAATGRTCDPQEAQVSGYTERYALARIETEELSPEVRATFAPFVDGDRIRVGRPFTSPVVLEDAASLEAFAAGIRAQQAAERAEAEREAAERAAKAEDTIEALLAWADGGEGDRPYTYNYVPPQDLATPYAAAKERADRRSEHEAREQAKEKVAARIAQLTAYAAGELPAAPQRDWCWEVREALQRVPREQKAAFDAALAAAAARDARDAEAEERERERQAAEKRTWVEAHGSPHLQRAVAAGYDCQRQYVTERAAGEFPGFTVDFDGGAGWKSRACPSEAALALALAHPEAQAEVVWLTCPVEALPEPDPYDDEPGWEAREAVVIPAFLGRYPLVRIV